MQRPTVVGLELVSIHLTDTLHHQFPLDAILSGLYDVRVLAILVERLLL